MAVSIKKGTRYKAQLKLNWVESFASNSTVAGKFKEVGFDNVLVEGSGYNRVAYGTWTKATIKNASSIIPSQVVKVEEVKKA